MDFNTWQEGLGYSPTKPHHQSDFLPQLFAKTDSQADDIFQIVREEFGESSAFCKKVTYKTFLPTPDPGPVPAVMADTTSISVILVQTAFHKTPWLLDHRHRRSHGCRPA